MTVIMNKMNSTGTHIDFYGEAIHPAIYMKVTWKHGRRGRTIVMPRSGHHLKMLLFKKHWLRHNRQLAAVEAEVGFDEDDFYW